MERQDYIDELLVKSMLGEADEAQQEFVRNWRARSFENDRYYGQFEQVWRQSRQLAARNPVDVDAAWKRFQASVTDKRAPRRMRLFQAGVLRIAAGVLLLVGVVAASYLWWTGTVDASAGDGVLRQELPDGSFVTMNKQSKLSFPRHFTGANRIVRLDGEAFFSVSPDKAHPFLIDANGVLVRVVGTSFNVKSNKRRTEVIVETGVVEVTQSTEKVSLHPRERVLVSSGRSLKKEVSEDKLYNYYRTNEFVCDHTPLSRLVAVLEEAYGRRIEIAAPEKAQLQLTANFRNDGLQPVLAIVCETLNLQAIEKDGVIVIQ